MKIIKEGYKNLTTYRFECRRCGCIFECGQREVSGEFVTDAVSDSYTETFVVSCPTCGRAVTNPVVQK